MILITRTLDNFFAGVESFGQVDSKNALPSCPLGFRKFACLPPGSCHLTTSVGHGPRDKFPTGHLLGKPEDNILWPSRRTASLNPHPNSDPSFEPMADPCVGSHLITIIVTPQVVNAAP